VHSPDRLARKYAYQVLLVDEFRRAGVEVVFLNRALGQSPEDDLLLQVQGMIAEYERAKIIERHRRGKRHAAHVGTVNVLSGAPYGYQYVPKYEGGGHARYEIIPDEARVVRQVFAWVGHDRLTIGEVWRRLTQAGEVTRTGKTVWDRSVVWGLLKNPAYQGAAAFGKTRQEPLQPRLRPQRHRPAQPRRAVSTRDVPPEDWITIPVPALVEPEIFAAVQDQLQENKHHARQSRRGALYLLQGLLQCHHCGYAFYGKRLSPSARQGKPRAYAYYRCLGTDAYRFGGERVCKNTPVRTDLIDLAVWQELCALLAHPERLAEEYRRRLQPEASTKRPPLVTVENQISQLRQGVARLIDSYADGLIDKHEFEPRITRLRQRLARLEAQRQHLANEAASHAELQLIIGRLEDFATKVHQNLADIDWTSQRDLIRTLVKRVEVAQDQVNVVFRIDPYLGDPDLEKKSLQLCRGSDHATLGGSTQRVGYPPVFEDPGTKPGPNQPQHPDIPDPFPDQCHEQVMVNRVEVRLQIHIDDMEPASVDPLGEVLEGHPWCFVRTIPIGTRQEVGLKQRFNDELDRHLDDPVLHGRNAQRARLARCPGFGNVDPTDRRRPVLLGTQCRLNLVEKPSFPIRLDRLDVHPIDP